MNKLAVFLLVILTTTLASGADGFAHVRDLGGITEHKLESNGLRVLLLPLRSAPVATFMVTYHVGSRNEVTGTTGATHLLEHLMFKGTAKYDRSLGTGYDQVLERVGAETNATTWLDRTNYFATVPVNALPLLISVEADRMRNLSLREEDRRPEMTVVRNEFERGENSPIDVLMKEIWPAAFFAHPYHHDTIGWRSDIERVPITKLREFYDTFYWPDNATVTVIGDIDPAATLALIKQHYGAIPKSPKPFPEIYTEEPEQRGQRRVMLKRPGEIGVVMLAHKIPRASDADWPVVQVLGRILADGKTSRLYRALTDKNLTISTWSMPCFNRDPSLHFITAELADGVKHEIVEQKISAEIERVKKEGVSAGEVSAAVAALLAQRAFASDGTFATAEQINECIAVGDWTLHITLSAKLKAVTAADVQRVAKKYFVEDRSVSGWFVPVDDTGEAAPSLAVEEKFEAKTVLPPKAPETPIGPPPATTLASRVMRESIGGIDVLACRADVRDVVNIRLSMPAGVGVTQQRALAHLTAGMLERGTRKRDKFELARLLEEAGASITSEVNTDTVEFAVKCLAKDVPLVMSLLAEQVREPAFDAGEFAKLKKELSDMFRQTLEDTDAQAYIAFSRAIFPAAHPARRHTVEETLAEIEKANLAAVKAFHAEHYGPAEAHLVAVGDIDTTAFKTLAAKTFAGWKPQQQGTPRSRLPSSHPAEDQKNGETLMRIAGKESVSVVIGHRTTLRAGDAEWLPLLVASDVLGRGFTSRLIGNVRDREGLTYGIGAWMSEDTFRSGTWMVLGTFAPALLDKGMASTRREIEGWWRDGITADELDYRKSAIAGQFTVGLETTDGLAAQLLLCAERGFAVTWLDEFPAKVNSLTLEQVNAALKKHASPARMATVKAGTLGEAK